MRKNFLTPKEFLFRSPIFDTKNIIFEDQFSFIDRLLQSRQRESYFLI